MHTTVSAPHSVFSSMYTQLPVRLIAANQLHHIDALRDPNTMSVCDRYCCYCCCYCCLCSAANATANASVVAHSSEHTSTVRKTVPPSFDLVFSTIRCSCSARFAGSSRSNICVYSTCHEYILTNHVRSTP
jgi:hypothetical protein